MNVRTSNAGVIDQLLHGYSEGHRLLESSIRLPDKLTRLALRMSDLSGPNVVAGFEKYLTGYPLQSLSAYALAKTWYAPEMKRPGCVWTHTLVIPYNAFVTLDSLALLLSLFRRPNGSVSREMYREPLPFSEISQDNSSLSRESAEKFAALIERFYGDPEHPLVIASANSYDFEDAVFALWSQQWPALRAEFTFSTGSLSPRFIGTDPFDLQCAPVSVMREFLRDARIGNPSLLEGTDLHESPPWVSLATVSASGGCDTVRNFLWFVGDDQSDRRCFARFVETFSRIDAIGGDETAEAVVDYIGGQFPGSGEALRLKKTVLGDSKARIAWSASEREILLALATTERHAAFDETVLQLEERALAVWSVSVKEASQLIRELFRATLNPLGERILAGLILGVDADEARDLTRSQPALLSTLFRGSPRLAATTALWPSTPHRTRELFNAVATDQTLSRGLRSQIIHAVLEAKAEGIEEQIVASWGEPAVCDVLDWAEAHKADLSDAWRLALASQSSSLLRWVKRNSTPSTKLLMFLVQILDPRTKEVQSFDSSIWLRILDKLSDRPNERLARFYAFVLSLGLANVPSQSVQLVQGSFPTIHELAATDQLDYDSWLLLEPYVPELGWIQNWDKCERLQRGLVKAFVRYRWPVAELLRCLDDTGALSVVKKSARKVEGGKRLFDELIEQIQDGKIKATDGQKSVLRA